MQPLRWMPLACAAAATSLAAAPLDPVTSLAGRYSRHFQSGTVDGDIYWTDDVVEIVPVDHTHAYVRFELQFFNGHSCSLSGIVQTQGETLVYREKGGECALRIERRGKTLFWNDGTGGCHSYCGSRGGFADGTLSLSSKRPIRYMARLKRSPQYRAALSEWRGN